MLTADLHFHSTHSDGKHAVSWVVETLKAAKAGNLGLAVLTDHDGIQGYEEFAEGVKAMWTPICASELSCTFHDAERGKDRELHLLVYGLDPKDNELNLKFEKFKEERSARFFRIAEKLKEAGYPIDAEGFAKKHPGVLGRPHIADALMEAGIVRNRLEAFERFLKDEGRFFVEKWRFPLEDAVAYAKRKGAKTSIAHPGQYGFKDSQLQHFKDLGVDGIEVYHPRHQVGHHAFYQEAAHRYGFFITGGSDFHSDDTDQYGTLPSLGKAQLPFDMAKKFLGNLL